MKMNGAVLWDVHQEWSVEEVELDGPQEGEVLVSFEATGLCHSDHHMRTGDLPGALPLVGGHEGAGVVQEVGPDVKDLKPGDHVVASFIPACGRCRWCATGRQNLCDLGAMLASGTQLDEITKLIETNVLRPILDRAYPFDDAPQALAHVEGGRTKGKVVITMV